jgi:hypothetical protein
MVSFGGALLGALAFGRWLINFPGMLIVGEKIHEQMRVSGDTDVVFCLPYYSDHCARANHINAGIAILLHQQRRCLWVDQRPGFW